MLSDAEQLSQIDAEVTILQATIRQLYNKRNRFIPISRLPPEILSRVFLCLRGVCDSPNAQNTYPYNRQSKQLSWVITTHVCRQWRDVAFEFPELWTSIDLSLTVPWAEALLERSKAAPLAVTIPASLRDSLIKTAYRVLEQPQRLQVLKMSGDPQSPTTSKVMDLVKLLCGVSAPLLQSFTLNLESPYGHIASTTPILPRELCSGGTPLLRHLELKGCGIPWTSPLFNSLTSLTIISATYDVSNDRQSNFNDFFDALERMSNIQELDLCIAIPPVTESSTRHATVAFSKLKKLWLKSSLQDCTTILHHLAIPSSASVSLEVPGPRSDNSSAAKDAGSELASAIHGAWLTNPLVSPSTAPTFKPSIRALEITPAQIAGGTKARFWLQAIDLARKPIRLTKDKRRVIIPPPPAPLSLTTSPTSLMLIVTLPIQNLQSIDLKISVNKWMWAALAVLPSLQSIALNDETGPSFLTYICSDPVMKSRPAQVSEKVKEKETMKSPSTGDKAEPKRFRFRRADRPSYHYGRLILKKAKEVTASSTCPPAQPTYFPKLAHLAFTGVDFGLEQYSDPEDRIAIHWDRFLDFLLFRRESSKPIQCVRALSCINLMRADIVSIKAVVPKVEWDGVEEQRDDYDFEEDWDGSHDSDECEGQCDEHRYHHRDFYGSSLGLPHSLLAAGFGL